MILKNVLISGSEFCLVICICIICKILSFQISFEAGLALYSVNLLQYYTPPYALLKLCFLFFLHHFWPFPHHLLPWIHLYENSFHHQQLREIYNAEVPPVRDPNHWKITMDVGSRCADGTPCWHGATLAKALFVTTCVEQPQCRFG